jgi:hypothetical protein
MKLRERNLAVQKRVLLESQEIKDFRGAFKGRHGFDPLVESDKFPVQQPNFSWRKLETKLREADTSSAFSQFLRAGVQNITNGAYQSVETTHEDWTTNVQSSKDTELYAPNHGVAFPRQVGPSQLYPEVGAAALDIQLKNLKFGAIYALEKELLDDDQTGSFQQQSGMLGEYMKLLQEVLCYGKLASVANMQYIDYKIPTSETKPSYESAYPWSTSFKGGGANRPASYGALSQANIQNGIVGLLNQKNLQGIKMQVKPTRLIIGPTQQFDAAVLLNSAYYPSGAAAAGNTGGAFAINPIKGILDMTVSRFVFKNDGTVDGTSKAWYIVDDSRPWFILQIREAVTVEQEAVNAGEAFAKDVYRFKGRSRMNADFIDPRFAWQGNDGSV